MSDEVRTYWVIREGSVKGQGRYVGPKPSGPDWQDTRARAFRYAVHPLMSLNDYTHRDVCRIVKVTSKKPAGPAVTVDGMRLLINGRYVCNDYALANKLSLEQLAQRLRDALS